MRSMENESFVARCEVDLSEAGVAHTIRRGQLRFAVHAFNNEDDIERTVACVGEALGSL